MLGNAPLKLRQRLLALRFQADGDEDIKPKAKLGGVGNRDVAVNHARCLQRLDTREARRRAQKNPLRQFDVGQCAISLKFVQNSQISAVEVHLTLDLMIYGILCFFALDC